MNDWQSIYKGKLVSVEEAAKLIKSGDTIGISAGPSAPADLVNAIAKRYQELENVNIFSGLLINPFEYLRREYRGHINHHTIFMGPLERMFMGEGNIEVSSYHFSETDWLTSRLGCDTFMCECTPPDKHGYLNFGPLGAFNNDTAIKSAKRIIVQVNQKTPYVNGSQNFIHVSDVDYICESDHELVQIPDIPIADEERTIASFIVERIPDGATIQIGLGGLGNAVGYFLENKKDLGVHTEMLTDSMVALAKKGVITCKRKTFHPGRITCGFGIGSRELYDFMDRNPFVEVLPISYINNIENIAKNDAFVSINNALMVDLTGQVCSESLGFTMYSGTGGQVDFVRGSFLSKGGVSFMALKSYAKTKQGLASRIVAKLPPGTVVTTPRTDVQNVVTEYGFAELKGKSIPDRVKAMIAVSHPDFREALEKEAREVGLLRA
jgi:4-hydroxybutyrate CoA-transferase